jgi:hypothetical protein
MGTAGALAILGQPAATQDKPAAGRTSKPEGVRKAIRNRVWATPFIDTHEHLIEESERLSGTAHPRVKSDDWTMVLSHYIDADMLSAGMPRDLRDQLFSPNVDPIDKWRLLEPVWPAVRHTGYGQAVTFAVRALYGVEGLSSATIRTVQAGYEKTRRPGFYRRILNDMARIESCQVNCLSKPFQESAMPTLLMQDLSIVGMFAGPDLKTFGEPAGAAVASLEDWHRVIDWWFARYGPYAVAVKSQNAYRRDIDYERVAADRAQPLFLKKLDGRTLTDSETKDLEDHLFWVAVGKATEQGLPVKLHTGYYSGNNAMPLSRLLRNPGSACDLCRRSPDTRFVFMHIAYPHYEEMIALAKQYTNAYLDMCWAWIINPVAATDFLKKYLVTAPANKILTFGGDYVPVEAVAGHAEIARRGIALALSELVEEGWMGPDQALETIEPIMRGNARRIFNLDKKEKTLRTVPWG